MATTGSVDVNLTTFGASVNSGTLLASNVIGGVKDQGDLIGLAIGIALAVGLLFGIVFLVLGVVPRLVGKLRGLRSA